MVALLNCFILHGLALLLDGYLPQDRVKLLFSVKYFGLVFLAMLLIGIVLNLKISRLATKQTRKPHYPRIIVFMLISLSLLAYSGLVEMIG